MRSNWKFRELNNGENPTNNQATNVKRLRKGSIYVSSPTFNGAHMRNGSLDILSPTINEVHLRNCSIDVSLPAVQNLEPRSLKRQFEHEMSKNPETKQAKIVKEESSQHEKSPEILENDSNDSSSYEVEEEILQGFIQPQQPTQLNNHLPLTPIRIPTPEAQIILPRKPLIITTPRINDGDFTSDEESSIEDESGIRWNSTAFNVTKPIKSTSNNISPVDLLAVELETSSPHVKSSTIQILHNKSKSKSWFETIMN